MTKVSTSFFFFLLFRRQLINIALPTPAALSFKARKMPLMTDVQRRTRIQWARQYARWSSEMWEKVPFSDVTF